MYDIIMKRLRFLLLVLLSLSFSFSSEVYAQFSSSRNYEPSKYVTNTGDTIYLDYERDDGSPIPLVIPVNGYRPKLCLYNGSILRLNDQSVLKLINCYNLSRMKYFRVHRLDCKVSFADGSCFKGYIEFSGMVEDDNSASADTKTNSSDFIDRCISIIKKMSDIKYYGKITKPNGDSFRCDGYLSGAK